MKKVTLNRMVKKMIVRIFMLLAITCVWLASSAGAQNLSVYTENNPPVSYLEDGKPAGTAVEIVREILHRLKQPDNIKVVPWSRGYNLALKQRNVALFSATRLPQREKLFHWVGPIYTQTWGFYAKKGRMLYVKSLEDARNVGSIGTYRNDAKEQFLLKQGFSNTISANGNIINVRRLIQGNIDLWVSSDLNFRHIVQQAGENPSQLVLVHPFRKVENYIVFSIQTDKHIAEKWQQTLREIKQDGTYSRILNQ